MSELVSHGAQRVVILLGRRWALPVLAALQGDPLRHHELRRIVGGVSDKVLVETLRALGEAHLVTRTVYPEVPLRVEYALTDAAQALCESLEVLNDWAATYWLAEARRP